MTRGDVTAVSHTEVLSAAVAAKNEPALLGGAAALQGRGDRGRKREGGAAAVSVRSVFPRRAVIQPGSRRSSSVVRARRLLRACVCARASEAQPAEALPGYYYKHKEGYPRYMRL